MTGANHWMVMTTRRFMWLGTPSAVWTSGSRLPRAAALYLSSRNALLDQKRCNSLCPPHGQFVIPFLRARQIGVTDNHKLWRRPGSQDRF